jgi:hypothetical protein
MKAKRDKLSDNKTECVNHCTGCVKNSGGEQKSKINRSN